MKLKLNEVISSFSTLQSMKSEKMNSKLAFRFSSVISKLQDQIKLFEEVKVEKLNLYGTPVEDKPGHFDLGENAEKYTNEMNELLSSEVELDFMKIKLEDINIDVAPESLMNLGWLIEE